jgi:hypothetical protein
MNVIPLESERARQRSADPVQGELRGHVRSARLAWTDPESGDRLTVDLHGSEGFLRSLERQGFEPIEGAHRDTPWSFLASMRRAWSARVRFARGRAPVRPGDGERKRTA